MNASERELSWRMAKWYVVAMVRPLYETIATTVNELGKPLIEDYCYSSAGKIRCA
jgi:hypothetical protein